MLFLFSIFINGKDVPIVKQLLDLMIVVVVEVLVVFINGKDVLIAKQFSGLMVVVVVVEGVVVIRGGLGKSIWGSHPSCVRLRQLWLYD